MAAVPGSSRRSTGLCGRCRGGRHGGSLGFGGFRPRLMAPGIAGLRVRRPSILAILARCVCGLWLLTESCWFSQVGPLSKSLERRFAGVLVDYESARIRLCIQKYFWLKKKKFPW